MIKHQVKAKNKQTNETHSKPNSGIGIHLILSNILGLLFYFVSLSCLPWGANYYFADEKKIEIETTEFSLINHQQDNGEVIQRTTYSNVHFKHNDYPMSVRVAYENKFRYKLFYTVQKGFLGFDVITEFHLNDGSAFTPNLMEN